MDDRRAPLGRRAERGGLTERVRCSPSGEFLAIERCYGTGVIETARSPRGKRLFDLAFSGLVLAATAPLWGVIMLAIWLEDGRPFFYTHRRQTAGGRSFGCLKFRTMRKDAGRLRSRLHACNRSDGPQFKVADDPRVLRVGRWLRRWDLDELPQFINVLRGEMSVVGPRPSPDEENQFCPAWREIRLSVRPGVTGLWQVRRTRRPGVDFQEWIRFDLEYVRGQGWRQDLRLIAQTPLAMLSRADWLERRRRGGGTAE